PFGSKERIHCRSPVGTLKQAVDTSSVTHSRTCVGQPVCCSSGNDLDQPAKILSQGPNQACVGQRSIPSSTIRCSLVGSPTASRHCAARAPLKAESKSSHFGDTVIVIQRAVSPIAAAYPLAQPGCGIPIN